MGDWKQLPAIHREYRSTYLTITVMHLNAILTNRSSKITWMSSICSKIILCLLWARTAKLRAHVTMYSSVCTPLLSTHSLMQQCEPGSRSLEDSRDIQLMKETVTSSNGPRPLLTSEKYLFDKIVVSQVTALDNRTYDIVFVAAHSSG